LLLIRNRTEELLHYLLLVLLPIVAHVVVFFLLVLLKDVIVLDQHVEVKPNHEEETVGLFLLDDDVPVLLFSENDRLLELLFGVDEVFVDPD